MKVLTVCMAVTLALPAMSAFAANADKAVVTRDFTDTVAPAQTQAYMAGVKAYNQCLREHGVKFNEYAVNHETGGDTYTFSYEIGPYTWADFDALDAQSKPCDAVWLAQANPHLKRESSSFSVIQPDMSHMRAKQSPLPTQPLFHIANYTLKPGRSASTAFTDAVKKITAAAAKTHWPYYWETDAIEGGGDGAPDYQLVISEKNWADVGVEASPSLWKMVASVYGQSDADAIRKSLDDSIAKSSDHFDRYNANLSYIAGK